MRKIILSFAIITLFIGCSADYDESSTEPANNIVTDKFGGNDYVLKQAEDFIRSFSYTTRSGMTSTEISTVIPIRQQEVWPEERITRSSASNLLPDTILYAVNLGNNNGYLLVSADVRVPGVVAYIEKGSYSQTQTDVSPGEKVFIEGLHDFFVSELEKSSLFDSFEPVGPVGPYGTWEFDEYVGPLLSTTWGQGSPYNMFCYTDAGLQAVAGCVAIAIGQIVAYHQYPSLYSGHTYNWNAILQNSYVTSSDSVASESVAHLVHDIGLLVHMSYGTTGSGATFDNVEYCWNAFNYHYTKMKSCSFDTLMVNIQSSHPVYMKGRNSNNEGHAWVVDGIAIRTFYYPEMEDGQGNIIQLTGDSYNLIHCNWGWDGFHNGFFVYGALQNKYNLQTDGITSTPTGYNNSNYIYHHIYPND